MSELFEIINTIRNMRAEMEVGLQNRIEIKLSFEDKTLQKSLEPLLDYTKNLARIENLILNDKYSVQSNEYVVVLKDLHIAMPLAGIADSKEQIRKNELKIEKLNSEIKNKEAMLENKNFLQRAPKEIVETERTKLADMRAQIEKLQVIINGLR